VKNFVVFNPRQGNRMGGLELDLSSMEWAPESVSCKNDNKHSGSIKRLGFFD
jgi:hypothetical protein